MTPIIPKMTARPRASRTSVAMPYTMPNAVTASRSMTGNGVARAPPGRRPQCSEALELRSVLRRLVRVLDQIAHLHGVGGRYIRVCLDDREAARFVHLRQMH